MGAPKITENYGDTYHTYLAKLFPPFSRRVDMCAYFFRRAAEVVGPGGIVGLLATNSIREGNTRRGGLDPLLQDGFSVIRARRDFLWPGTASVIASGVHLAANPWSGGRYLNGERVPGINALLEPARDAQGLPVELFSNRGLCFQGGTIWGDGFYLSEEEARRMLEVDANNIAVVRRALGGQELNAGDTTGSRWIIDFGDRTEREAEEFAAPFEHLQRTVKDWRLSLDAVKYRRIVRAWWKHFHAREDLYEGIERMALSRVICRSRVSRRHMLSFVNTGIFFLDAVIVFLFDTESEYAVLQSSLHETWCQRYASRLKSDLRYGASNCFNPFPFPSGHEAARAQAARAYIEARGVLLDDRGLGLTGAYGVLDNARELSEDVLAWRRAVAEQDAIVARCYGWGDVPLDHGFVETDQGVQYSISVAARAILLDRLLELNHARYEDEVRMGLHAKKAPKKRAAEVLSNRSDPVLFEVES
jgi:hypothetical protein